MRILSNSPWHSLKFLNLATTLAFWMATNGPTCWPMFVRRISSTRFNRRDRACVEKKNPRRLSKVSGGRRGGVGVLPSFLCQNGQGMVRPSVDCTPQGEVKVVADAGAEGRQEFGLSSSRGMPPMQDAGLFYQFSFRCRPCLPTYPKENCRKGLGRFAPGKASLHFSAEQAGNVFRQSPFGLHQLLPYKKDSRFHSLRQCHEFDGMGEDLAQVSEDFVSC